MNLSASAGLSGVLRTTLSADFVWWLAAVVLLCAAVLVPGFFSVPNLTNLLTHSVVLGLLVLAESLCLISGHFDLSVESTMVFTAVLAGWLLAPGGEGSIPAAGPVTAIAAMLAAGLLIGAGNGMLVAYLKLNALIATLAVSIIMAGAGIMLTGGRTLGPLPHVFCFPGGGWLGPVPVPVCLLVLCAIVVHFLLSATVFGRKLYATGGNPQAAHAAGVDVRVSVLAAYAIAGFLSALAGLLLAGRMGASATHMTHDNLLYTFAAAVIGGVSPFGGEGRVAGMMGGVILLISINKLLTMARVDPFMINLFTGSIILLAMLILTLKKYGVRE